LKFIDRFKLGISAKGAIMVAIPLAFELFFLSVLIFQLDQAEKDRIAAAHIRAVRAQSDVILADFYDAAAMLLPFAGNPNSMEGGRYREIVRTLPKEVDKLVSMAVSDSEKEHLQSARPTLMRGVALLEDLEKMVNESNGDFTGLMRLQKRRKEIAITVGSMKGELNRLLAPSDTEAFQLPQRELESVARTKLFIYIGALASVLVALLVAYVFSKEIVDRLKTISDNSLKISLNEPLNPPVGGDDEISGLDKMLRRMAVSLRDARRKESAVLDNALDVICSIDKNNRITSINPAALSIWGYEPVQLLGANVLELAGGQSRTQLLQALEGHKKSPVFSQEVIIETASGQPREMRWSANYGAEEESWFCVVHDISAAKEVERLKQQFVAMVSHDLRTPLNSLLNLLTLLSENAYGQLSETGHKRVLAVEGEIERLIKLINELLDLEKMEAGIDSLSKESVAVSDICDASINAVLGYAAANKVQLVNDCRSRAVISVDRARVIQVLVNLLSNAIKFSPAGESVVLLGQDLSDAKGRASVRISVQDKGCGIADEKLTGIFERFTQLDGEKKKEGTGLGLAISKAIVSQHQGRIGVESKLGAGSVFWLELGSI